MILDANRLGAAWRLGMLYNGFADGLQSVVDDLKPQVPGLAILNSTSPGQTAWTSPETLGQSVFAHYVRLALEGAAGDERFGGGESEDISLGELQRFVRRNVRVAVKNAYADVQEPMLVVQGGSQPEDESR